MLRKNIHERVKGDLDEKHLVMKHIQEKLQEIPNKIMLKNIPENLEETLNGMKWTI